MQDGSHKLRDVVVTPILLIAIVTLFLFVLSYIRYLDLYTSNWDLGIFQQALWTSAHGWLFYESGDYEFFGVTSYFEVHTSFMLYAIAPLYNLFPSAATLLLIQALFFSSSIVPLYILSRDIGMSSKTFLIISVVIVVNPFILSSLFFDFHLMSLIPTEFLFFFLALRRRRYLLSVFILILGSFTLEVFPFLVVGVLLYFLLYEKTGIRIRGRIPKESVPLAALFICCIATYLLLRGVQTQIIPSALDNLAGATAYRGELPRIFPESLNLAILPTSIFTWVLFYATFAFIPLLRLRYLLLVLPWMYESILLSPQYTTLGSQYWILAMAPIAIGLVHGVNEIVSEGKARHLLLLPFSFLLVTLAVLVWIRGSSMPLIFFYHNWYLLILVSAVGVLLMLCLARPHRIRDFHKLAKRIFLLSIISLLLFNVAAGPFNSSNYQLLKTPGYHVSVYVNPESRYFKTIASKIPQDSTVLASGDLFPLVANDRNAYSLLWFTGYNYNITDRFPFNSTNLPDYVLVDGAQWAYLPNFLESKLNNSLFYGLEIDVVYQEGYPGCIFLYKLNFSGLTLDYYP